MSDKEKTVEELKAEIERLYVQAGRHPSGRKVRTDKGQTHEYIRTQTTPRADKGKPRSKYSKESPTYLKKLFTELLRKNTNQETGEGDNFIRDANMIFPPNVTHYYKKVTVKPRMKVDKRTGNSVQQEGYTYRSSQKRVHPEELRWRWYYNEYIQETDETKKMQFLQRMCDWYFIYPHDIDMWTYQEWAWSYVNVIQGYSNRRPQEQEILSYDAYASGHYGIASFDLKGDLIWPN